MATAGARADNLWRPRMQRAHSAPMLRTPVSPSTAMRSMLQREVATVTTLRPSPTRTRTSDVTTLADATQFVPPPGRTLPRKVTRFQAAIPVSKHDTKWKACGTYAHLAVSGCQDSGDSNKRVAEVREMLQEKYNRQLSGNIYHAYRRMAHYTNATDPHQKCLYPRHLARFLGDLGVSVSESEACSLLCRERSAKSLRQPFGAATFHAAMLGKCPSSLAGSKT
ncbi:unnamed protein product [Effrenium voratum]|nr:unnamed protein product [Effrenium voratum]